MSEEKENQNGEERVKNYKFGTRAIHSGQEPDVYSGALVTPISLSTTFQQYSPGKTYPGGYEYSRTGNPTRDTFEECVASLENAQWGLAFASGSATLSCIIHLLKSGDEVISMNDVYGGTYRYMTKVASPFGVKFHFVDFTEISNVESKINENTKLLWLETPSNPTLTLVDIELISKCAKKHNLIFVVDNTFLSPYFQNPLDHGSDLVVHSVTKYINGHSDVVMGVVCGNDLELYKRLKFLQNAIGSIPSPFDCFLALRGIKTLHVRMKQHNENAQIIAEYLETRVDKIETVIYPNLQSHPQYEVCKKQMRGGGGMITFFLRGGITQSRQFLENLKVFALAESLGAVESLLDHPAIMTHASIPKEEREKIGITDNLVRLSVGIEDVNDLLEDLKIALSFVNLDDKE
jgi:cystathionine gamma-lyase